MRPRPLATAALAAAVLVTTLLSSCDEEVSGGSGAASDNGATSKNLRVLCRAVEAAEQGAVDEARGLFADVHGDLHVLAGVESDRAIAGRLLEAKQRVEASLAGVATGSGAGDAAGSGPASGSPPGSSDTSASGSSDTSASGSAPGSGSTATALEADLRALAAAVAAASDEPVPEGCG